MLLAFWESGWQAPLAVAIIVLVAYILVMWIAALVWTYRDIQARTSDQFTQMVGVGLVVVFNLPGLLLYLILRPKDTIDDAYDRRLEAEALLNEIQDQPTCPSCRRRIQDDFVVCPFCRATLRTSCDACGKALASTWAICPFCAAERSAPVRPIRSSPAPAPAPAAAKRASTATYTPPAAKPSATEAPATTDATP